MIPAIVPGSTTPAEWFIVFRQASPIWLAEKMAFGRYKHVSCFGPVPAVAGWLFFDFGVHGAFVNVVPDYAANAAIGAAVAGAVTVVRWTSPPDYESPEWHLKPVFVCTTAVAHLTGVPSCALRPDRFLRDCLAAGAETVIAGDEDVRWRQVEARPGA